AGGLRYRRLRRALRPLREEALFGHFPVLADDEAEHAPPAPRQRPAADAYGFEAEQQRNAQSGDDHWPFTCAKPDQPADDRQRDKSVNDEAEPEPVHQQPKRRRDKRPPVESVAHEDEAFRFVLALALRRRMHGVGGHRRPRNSRFVMAGPVPAIPLRKAIASLLGIAGT